MMEAVIYGGTALIALIVWLVRVEAKANRNTETIRDIHEQLKQHLERDDDIHFKVMEALSEIREDVSEIKGYLKH